MKTGYLISVLMTIFVAAGTALAEPRNGPPQLTTSNPFINGGSPGMLLSKKWDDLSEKEKKKVLKARDRYEKLPKEKKDKLRKKWENMSPEEKKKYKLERKYR